jgi:hypothetical protein
MQVTRECDASAAEQFFADQIADRARADKLATQLTGLGEPPLACGTRPGPVYRLFGRIWFGTITTVLRLEQTDNPEALFLTIYRQNKPRIRRRLTPANRQRSDTPLTACACGRDQRHHRVLAQSLRE